MKVVLVFANLGPYHVARIEAFRQVGQKMGWTIAAIELARSQSEYPWQLSMSEVPIRAITLIDKTQLEQVSNLKLIRRLRDELCREDPDVVVIAGYFRVSMIFALLWGKYSHKKCILMSESKQDDFKRSTWRERIKSWIVNHYDAALVGGKAHMKYLSALNFPVGAIFYGYDVVDNQIFHPNTIRVYERPIINPYFLVISRFVHKKNLEFMIAAYAKYRSVADPARTWDLVICGDGEDFGKLEKHIIQLNLVSSVHCPGFLQQSDLLPYLAHAEALIHASIQEQWGLVVNEAMAAGLPVIVSNKCGCYEELVLEGKTGFGFNPHNEAELVEIMLKFSNDVINRKDIGKAAFEHIQRFSPSYFSEGLSKAVKHSLIKV